MLVVAIFLAALSFYLYRRLVVATALNGSARRTAVTVLVLFWVAAVVGTGSGEVFSPSWGRYVAFPGLSWLAALMYLVLGSLLIGVAAGVVRLVGRTRRRDTARARTTVVRRSSAVLVLGTVAAVGYGIVEAATPQVTRTVVPLAALPDRFDGMRVAVISDLHVGPTRGADFVDDVVESVMGERPDLIVVAGDLVDGTVDLVGPELEPLSRLAAPMGVVVTSGNHEFYAGDGGAWLDLYDSLGLTVLRNESTVLERDGESIDLVGVEDATAPEPYEPDLASALTGTDPERFQLLVAHQPLQAVEASDRGVDMQVSGHTHGGQIWPVVYLVPLQQPSVQGLDTIGNTTLYTTRGAGTWGPPVRVGAPPEISVLELRAAG